MEKIQLVISITIPLCTSKAAYLQKRFFRLLRVFTLKAQSTQAYTFNYTKFIFWCSEVVCLRTQCSDFYGVAKESRRAVKELTASARLNDKILFADSPEFLAHDTVVNCYSFADERADCV